MFSILMRRIVAAKGQFALRFGALPQDLAARVDDFASRLGAGISTDSLIN
ncbi:hypothetical protein [Arthrobacter sp. SO5]|nr:hypothetical protein [Arthrobacter sp. SO5]